jgi:hypothetical protein
MKDIILLYDDCCIYEIVILNYFLKFTNSEMLFCSVDGQAIQAMEGYSIKCNISLEYYGAAEPPVRKIMSQCSGAREPVILCRERLFT